jgi:hypothetical protein
MRSGLWGRYPCTGGGRGRRGGRRGRGLLSLTSAAGDRSVDVSLATQSDFTASTSTFSATVPAIVTVHSQLTGSPQVTSPTTTSTTITPILSSSPSLSLTSAGDDRSDDHSLATQPEFFQASASSLPTVDPATDILNSTESISITSSTPSSSQHITPVTKSALEAVPPPIIKSKLKSPFHEILHCTMGPTYPLRLPSFPSSSMFELHQNRVYCRVR